MIVPRSKLLHWVAMIVLPFTLLGAVVPGTLPISLGAIGLLFVTVIIDALLSSKVLAGISVELAAINRMSKDREAKLEIRVRNERQLERMLRIALPLPREFASGVEQMDVVLPAQSEWSRLAWACTPAQRGNYRLHSAYVEGHSPLGFWAVRAEKPIQAEIRVYPNLLSDRKSLAALFLNRGAFGLHAQRQVGKGRDFEKLREYVAGDSFDEIHWKATARRGRPITKVFQIEKTQEVYVIVDASRLSARKTVSADSTGEGAPILERYVTAALVLGLAAEQQGDLFGLLTFTDKVEKFVRAKNGKAHYSACRDALYTLQPKVATPDFDELSTFIRLRLRRRALLLFLTSLDDPALAESFVRNLELIRRQHVVVVNMIQPPAATALFTNPNIASVDDLYQHLGGHLQWQKLRELGKVLQRRGVQFSLLQNERLSAELVSQYLNVKQRQLV
jgi:uncharacterized protein (DUF58 family)